MPSPKPRQIIDSHIHLWPASAANSTSHTWMSDGHPLARKYLLDDYITSVSKSESVELPSSISASSPASSRSSASSGTKRKLMGAIYLETDRILLPGSTLPPSAQVSRWKHPLEEVAFLRQVIEGGDPDAPAAASEDDRGAQNTIPSKSRGKKYTHGDMLLALIPWAPVDQGPEVLDQYLETAEAVAGAETWSRVKGVRYLVQGLRDRNEYEDVVLSDRFIEGVMSLADQGEKGWVFDVGVDQRSGGIWQLGGIAQVIRRCREDERGGFRSVRFVLNHLCKPSLTSASDFEDWKRSMQNLSRFSQVYIKLSGLFSELPTPIPSSAAEIYTLIQPHLRELFALFGPKRIMFGSDWPVCNVNGPGGAEGAWDAWYKTVEYALKELGLSEEEKERVWCGTAKEAYYLDEGEGKGLEMAFFVRGGEGTVRARR